MSPKLVQEPSVNSCEHFIFIRNLQILPDIYYENKEEIVTRSTRVGRNSTTRVTRSRPFFSLGVQRKPYTQPAAQARVPRTLVFRSYKGGYKFECPQLILGCYVVFITPTIYEHYCEGDAIAVGKQKIISLTFSFLDVYMRIICQQEALENRVPVSYLEVLQLIQRQRACGLCKPCQPLSVKGCKSTQAHKVGL